ncbi:MAG TPA: sigma-70 family RNA polymerase sigma factor [Streptosporangiaceae bacterium]
MTQLSAPQLRSVPLDQAASGDPGGRELREPGQDAEAIVIQLYRENGAFVLSYVTGLLRDRHLAEDVVQETMLRAWRHCAQFSEQKGSVRGWLIKVAHNVAMDKIRMRRSRPAEVAEDAAPEALVADHADAVVTAVHVRDALDRLSPSHRAVIEEIYLNGRTAREAAAKLGIPEGTVFSRSYYALRILRRELGVPAGVGGAAA